jgi:hypothetical protein
MEKKDYIVLLTDDSDYVTSVSFDSIDKAKQFIREKRIFIEYTYNKENSNIIDCYVNDMAVAFIIEKQENQNLYMIAKQVYDETVFLHINRDMLFSRYISMNGNTDIYIDDNMYLLRISSLMKEKQITNKYLKDNNYRLHSTGLRYRYARSTLMKHLMKR